MTDGGNLTLDQTAIGGNGGSTATGTGGRGGNAKSTLIFNDTTNATQSASITSGVVAAGGVGGGNGNLFTANSGNAEAVSTITGSQVVTSSATADGGANYGTGGAGGEAIAQSTATGATVYSDATAAAGEEARGPAGASATATGNASGGTVTASAKTEPLAGQVFLLQSTATASVSGSSTAIAKSFSQAGLPGFITSGQAVALGLGLPNPLTTQAILTNNPKISAAFGPTPTVLAMEELGGGYATGGTGAETSTSMVSFSASLLAADMAQDLKIGLFGGTYTGSSAGVTGVTLDISANGATLVDESFSSGAAAAAYFHNHAIDLGSLGGSLYSSGVLDVMAQLTVTTDSAGSGFYGKLAISG
jgi:hypothetical protein